MNWKTNSYAADHWHTMEVHRVLRRRVFVLQVLWQPSRHA